MDIFTYLFKNVLRYKGFNILPQSKSLCQLKIRLAQGFDSAPSQLATNRWCAREQN